MQADHNYMGRAIQLAGRGEGFTAPNPMVGAVIVRDGRILGEGYHERWGGLHAERQALANCREDPAGAELYVTLTPCCHFGKTPPCTDAILQAGIRRVIIGSRDPNPAVGEKSIRILQEAGVQVERDVRKEECDKLNSVFFHFITRGLPYVAMKYAMTADGKIATRTGDSKWITGADAREHVHRLRHRYTAIMVGIGTVLADDPLLTCRASEGRNPIRILCDSRLRLPVDSRLLRTAAQVRTIVAAVKTPQSEEKKKILESLGAEVLWIPANSQGEGLDMRALMKELSGKGVDSILLEGGGTLNESVLRAGLVNRVYAYMAPKLFGGGEAKTPVEGWGVEKASEAYELSQPEVTVFKNGDLLLEYAAEERGGSNVYGDC